MAARRILASGKNMKIYDYRLAAMFDSASTFTGAWVVFFLGVNVGIALTGFVASPGLPNQLWMNAIESLSVISFMMFMLWGLPLMLIYIIIFYGLLWGEWNKLLCLAIYAMVTSVFILLASSDEFFSHPGSTIRCIAVEGFLALLIVFSIVFARLKNRLIDPSDDTQEE